jgi:hypothetical protein
VVILLSLYAVTKLLFTKVRGNMHDLCDLEALKNVAHDTPVVAEEFITHIKHDAYFLPSNQHSYSPNERYYSPTSTSLLHSSTGLPSRPLNHIHEETTEGIHAQARGSTM